MSYGWETADQRALFDRIQASQCDDNIEDYDGPGQTFASRVKTFPRGEDDILVIYRAIRSGPFELWKRDQIRYAENLTWSEQVTLTQEEIELYCTEEGDV